MWPNSIVCYYGCEMYVGFAEASTEGGFWCYCSFWKSFFEAWVSIAHVYQLFPPYVSMVCVPYVMFPWCVYL